MLDKKKVQKIKQKQKRKLTDHIHKHHINKKKNYTFI